MSESETVADHIQLLRGLRSVREFQPDPVPQAALDDMLDVARWTGSARNLQPWHLVLVRDRATRERLAAIEGYAKHLVGAPLGIILVMDGDNAEYATYDEGKLGERIMLAAAAHGLGSCIGWWTPSGREEAKQVIGAPPSSIVRTVLSIGYPAIGPRRKNEEARKPLVSFVHEERFS